MSYPTPSHASPVYPKVQTPESNRSGLLYLRDQVAAYFQDQNIPAQVAAVGLKYRSFALNQSTGGGNRIVFIPGEFDGESQLKSRPYGTLSRNLRNSASVVNPRELLNWERPFTISVWAAPVPGLADSESYSIGIVEDLLEQVIRAIQACPDPGDPSGGSSIAASIVWGGVIIKSPPTEQAFGTELLVSAIQNCPFFGPTLDFVIPTAKVTRNGA
jgi:hypothetical protein